MPKQWMALVVILGLATTLLNLAILTSQIATPASARAAPVPANCSMTRTLRTA